MKKSHNQFSLCKSEFRHNLKENFSSGVLTLISIVQGVTLAIASQKGVNYIESNVFDLVILIHLSTAFLCITGMFYYYYYFVSIFFLPPTLFQVFILFGLGTAELSAAYSIGIPKLFVGLCGLVFFAATVAFINTFYFLDENSYSEDFKYAYALYKKETINNITCFILMLFVTFTVYCLYPDDGSHYLLHECLFLAINGSIYLYIIWYSHTRFLVPLIKMAGEDSNQHL